MSPVLELVPRDTVQYLFTVVDDFEALLERGRLLRDVTATYQEKTVGISLNVLEVMLKLVRNVYSALQECLLEYIVHVDHFRVSLQDVDPLKRLPIPHMLGASLLEGGGTHKTHLSRYFLFLNHFLF